MIQEQSVLEMMDDYKDKKPQAAEAAYLIALGKRSDCINRNLQQRYGNGQGYAQFKEDFSERFDSELVSSYGIKAQLDEDRTESFDDITVDDVDIPLDQVIQSAFLTRVEPTLRESVESKLSELDDELQRIAGILCQGVDAEIWDLNPNTTSVWDLVTLSSRNTLTDRQKESRLNDLVEAGVVYYYSGSGLSYGLTPMLTNVKDPFDHLPEVKAIWP